MWTQSKQNTLNAYILFLIWPFFALVYALVNYKSAFAKNIVWLFCGFYGYTFVLFDSGDAHRYRDWFWDLAEQNYNVFEFTSLLFAGEIGRGDYLEPFLSYIVGQFIGDWRVLFMAYGLVFGYFFSRNIWYLINLSSGRLKTVAVPFLIYFAVSLPFWYINGFRFYTAAQIFLYGAIRLFVEKKFKYLIIAGLSVFAHLGFGYAVLLLFVHYIVKGRAMIYGFLLVFATFFSSIDLATILSWLPKFDGVLGDRVNAYTHPEMVEAYFDQSQRVWFMRLKPYIIQYLSFAFIVLTLFLLRKRKINPEVKNIFYFGVLVFSTTLVLNIIPSMQRFFTISTLFLSASFFLIFQKLKASNWMNLLNFILTLGILYIFVLEFRVGFASMNVNLFITNPIIAPALENKVAVLEFYNSL